MSKAEAAPMQTEDLSEQASTVQNAAGSTFPTTATSSSAATNSVMSTSNVSSTVPSSILVRPGEPPRLKTLDIPDVVHFKLKLKQYQDVLENARRQGAGATAFPQSVITLVDPNLLSVILKHLMKIEMKDLTDAGFMKFLEEYLASDTSTHREIPSVVASSLKLNLKLKPKARVIDLVQQLETLIEIHNWQRFFYGTKEGIKNYVEFLVDVLKPKAFKEEMVSYIRFNNPAAQSDHTILVDHMLKVVENFEHYLREFDRNIKPSDGPRGFKRASPNSNLNRSEAKKPRTAITCLKCHNVGHHMKVCPQHPSVAEQKKLIEQYKLQKQSDYNNKNKSKTGSRYIKLARIFDSSQNEAGTVKAALAGGSVVCDAILDSGADATIISGRLCAKLTKLIPDLIIHNLQEKITLEMPNGHTTIIDQSLDIDIMLQTRMGQLIVQKQHCLIWNDLNEDLLLGNDMLSALGINPRHTLDTLVASHNSYNDIFPIEYASIHPDIGHDIETELYSALVNKVKEAVENGMSHEYEQQLLELLIRRKNVFRLKLGPDAPASVTPFITHLKTNAKSVRCKARLYTKDQSEFLKEFTDSLVKFGLIYENYNSEWASPVQVVRKEKGYRMVVDLRAVNAQCEPTTWPMPFLESIVQHLSKAKIWFILDAFK